MTRFCRDCRFNRRTIVSPPTEYCHRPRPASKPNPVTGEVNDRTLCDDERHLPPLLVTLLSFGRRDVCGPEGKYFQPRDIPDVTGTEPERRLK